MGEAKFRTCGCRLDAGRCCIIRKTILVFADSIEDKIARFPSPGSTCEGLNVCNEHIGQKMKSSLKYQGSKDRRKAHRFDAYSIPNPKIIIQGVECEAKLISISRGGACIECGECMSPDSLISLHLPIAQTTHHIKGWTTRSVLSSANGKEPQYQTAIIFEEDFMYLPAHIDSE
jgi:hypothetical protein